MNRFLMAAVVMLAFAPAGAIAQERAGDAALGAVSGAIVLGPVGAVAGALIGYTAGPSISRSWGVRGSHPARSGQSPRDAGRAARAPARTQEAMNANGQVKAAGSPRAQAAPPAQAAPVAPAPTQAAPPVQALE
jgi:hypothetical protein